MESSPDIIIENLSKAYGIRKTITALEGVSFSVQHGTCTALVGPNGAGKTTLLKIVAGIVKRYKGRVSIRGTVSLSPEISVNFPYMDATENVRYFSRITGNETPPSTILKELNLVPSGQLTYTFSKGMKRKLDVARAISIGANLICMDEPFDGLDPGASSDLAGAINNLKKLGVTFLISSHDLLRLNDVADRVVFLQNGKNAGFRDMKTRDTMVVKIKGELSLAEGVLSEIGCTIKSAEKSELHFERAIDIDEWVILRRLLEKGVNVTGLTEETLDSDYRRIFHGNTD